MGVGYERDLVSAIAAGMDMFDCVLPTRNARNGQAFTKNGQIHLRNACFAEDSSVIENGCTCTTCSANYSSAYLRHLFMSNETLAGILVSVHNIHHFQSLMIDIRLAIEDNSWSALPKRWPVLTMS